MAETNSATMLIEVTVRVRVPIEWTSRFTWLDQEPLSSTKKAAGVPKKLIDDTLYEVRRDFERALHSEAPMFLSWGKQEPHIEEPRLIVTV